MPKAFCKMWFHIPHRGQTQACTVSKFDFGSWSGHDAASQTAVAKHGASFKAGVACLSGCEDALSSACLGKAWWFYVRLPWA